MDQALFAVVMEACLHGVSTRKVDDLVKAFPHVFLDANLLRGEGRPPGRLSAAER